MAEEQAQVPVDPVYCYVLVRNDFETMKSGRSEAQVHHASSNLHMLMARRAVAIVSQETANDTDVALRLELFQEWTRQAGDFGTVIVLEGPMEDISAAVAFAQKAGYDAGITHDPEYWRTDGKKAFCMPEDTCGWALGRKGELRALLGRWPLLKPKE